MLLFPNAKINLGLNILQKRADGFHEIDSVMYPLPITDALEVLWSETGTDHFTVYGNHIPGAKTDNLCYKALELLRKHFTFNPVHLILLKNLPTGAGVGGGSSDAAGTLRLIAGFCGLQIEKAQLMEIAAELGSDCPFFIDNNPAHVSGRGEKLEKISLDLSGTSFILVFPGLHISTKDAFSKTNPKQVGNDTLSIIHMKKEAWRTHLKNDFEEVIARDYPSILEIRDELYESGAFYASLSGSGSAVFGLFEKPTEIPEAFLNFRCWKGKLS
jgi:4-diphosphocytidyl-2-C-methyl-D-erythritol kinase